MNPAQLFQYFEKIIQTPESVSKLRSLIIHLAVSGNLVPQEQKADSRNDFYRRVQNGIKQLASGCNRCRWNVSEPIPPDPTSDNLPAYWTFSRLNDTGLYINGIAFKPADWKNVGLPIIRIQNLSDETKEFNYTEGKFPDENMIREGDLLVSWSATLDVYIWQNGEGVLNQHIFKVIPNQEAVVRGYLYWLLKHEIKELAKSDHAHGLAMKHINRGPFLAHVVALPPLAEQHRIVAKVDELMSLCDRLETAQTERESRRDRLVASSLHRLNNGAEADAFQEHARFYFNHLPRLTTRPDHIKQLRQTILNLAVRSKLVEQDPTDEPASELLKRIQAEQEELIKARVLKPDGGDSRLLEDDFPWNLPPTWQWGTLRSLIVFGPQNGISPKPSSLPNAPRAITLTATTSGKFNPQHFKQVEATIPPDSEFWLRSGDLLFQRGNTREYVGIAAYYTGEPKLFLYPDLMMKVRLSQEVSLLYVHLCAIAPQARAYFSTHATGAQSTMPKINQVTLLQLPVPIPPHPEQHRIVAKVDELMALCDQLETQLTTTQTETRHLLDSLLHEALAPSEERVFSC